MECPDCGEPIEATVELDCVVNDDGTIEHHAAGSVKLYCSNDCGWKLSHRDFDGSWPDPVQPQELVES